MSQGTSGELLTCAERGRDGSLLEAAADVVTFVVSLCCEGIGDHSHQNIVFERPSPIYDMTCITGDARDNAVELAELCYLGSPRSM